MPSVFGYWTLKGLGQSCRFMLEIIGEDYQDNRFDLINAEDKWIEEKKKNPYGLAFPNLPYYVDGDIKLTQSSAIIRHLGKKSSMAATSDEEGRQLDMLEGVVIDVRSAFFDLCYGREEDFKSGLPETVGRVKPILQQISAYLGTKPWLLGERMTYVDVMLYDALTNWLDLQKDMLDEQESLRQLRARFEAIPAVKAYMESERFIKWPINGNIACWGGK